MLDLVTTTQFRKDLKRLRKRGADLRRLDAVLQLLLAEQALPEKHRDHALTGADYFDGAPHWDARRSFLENHIKMLMQDHFPHERFC